MTDEERSRLIAECENLQPISITTEGPRLNLLPDYAHDLNATMRAARRLDEGVLLGVNSAGVAFVYMEAFPKFIPSEEYHNETPTDPARAAFLALSDYLASREGK